MSGQKGNPDMLHLIARRTGSDFALFCNGRRFGQLTNCEVCYVYEGAFQEEISANLAGDMSLQEMLVAVRKAVETLVTKPTGLFSAYSYALAGQRRQLVGETLGLPALVAEGRMMVQQGCAGLRTSEGGA